ncbi:hypothetical protein CSAL01_08628 [Colletotrichum salicis]|uniref:Uncharacterized protein n=1 Tax=Colletotrichum salicis TaxID=1209931 RepID=A0A135V8F2_9PEZI|nr:hypothetical protein CSAL01_08628 [Colletotrichum salicis]
MISPQFRYRTIAREPTALPTEVDTRVSIRYPYRNDGPLYGSSCGPLNPPWPVTSYALSHCSKPSGSVVFASLKNDKTVAEKGFILQPDYGYRAAPRYLPVRRRQASVRVRLSESSSPEIPKSPQFPPRTPLQVQSFVAG